MFLSYWRPRVYKESANMRHRHVGVKYHTGINILSSVSLAQRNAYNSRLLFDYLCVRPQL